MTRSFVVAPLVVAAAGAVSPGWVEVVNATITAVGTGELPADRLVGAEVTRGALVLPGYVDLHMHGGGGYDVARSADDVIGAFAFHRAHGTTAGLASLMTAPVIELCAQLGRIADVIEAGQAPGLVGIHLEGPFLAASHCGAQDPRFLLPPDRSVLRRLLAAGRGQVRVVTLAPELPGALELLDYLVAAGVVVAVGHTDATYEQARVAFDRGASLVTHLFNAMRPLHHRDPGPAGAALDAGVACELINDGVHTHPAVAHLVGPDRLVLVTDAVSTAGAPDGEYLLGSLPVRVRDGEVRLIESGALAGSTLTMGEAVRRLLADSGFGSVAVAAASARRASAVLGMTGRRGSIAPGFDADLVVLDRSGRPTRVMQAGVWVDRPGEAKPAGFDSPPPHRNPTLG
ncbi:MAG: N-acetylglucosamine-6-phosphate deacetylase [Frankia sp.]